MICGNHDSFLKNSTDVNSLNIFRNTKNVHVIDKPEEIDVNGQRCLLVPWLTDLSVYGEETFDMMIGHFEISSKYLVQSYIEDNSEKRKTSDKAKARINEDALLKGGSSSKAADLIGNFVDLVKRGGRIYAGHIHKHREMTVKGRWFSFVGSPYQQNLGEMDAECGFYLLDSENRPKFVDTETPPRHIQVFMSEAMKDGYDFAPVAGNIV